MRARTLLAASLVVATGAGLVLASCRSFDAADQGSSSSDASVDDVSIDTQTDGAEEHDAGRDAAGGCPPPPAACEGGEALSCPGLDGRCFFYCPEKLPAEVAAARCRDWGDACLAGLTSPAHLSCLKAKTAAAGQHIYVDLFQHPDASSPDAGWSPRCATTLTPFEWNSGDPDDDDDMENGEEQCGILHDNGRAGDSKCSIPRPFVCERSR